MIVINNSLASLAASLNQALSGNKPSARIIFSKLNYKLLCFLMKLGFLRTVKFFKVGPNGWLVFHFQPLSHGRKIAIQVYSPSSSRYSYFKKTSALKPYMSRASLRSFFTSEIAIVSTPKGLMTSRDAVMHRLGGRVLLIIK